MQKTGFTLIELMLVVIIIGILAAMVVPNFVGRSEQARVAACKADIATIGLALDLYEMDNGQYPSELANLRNTTGGKNYLKKDPKDPWERPYFYRKPGTHGNDYDLYSAGPNGIENDEDDIGNWQ